jgi:acetate---CoA ligase (ADP-forming) subunit beta
MTKETNDIINKALEQNRRKLSEYESTQIMAGEGMPMAKGIIAQDFANVKNAAEEIGYPVVLKVCSPEVSHKTESGLVAVNLGNEADLEAAFQKISRASSVKEGGFLVQEMIKGARELVIGMIRDPQFGPCVMFGLGGIFTEIMGDVAFRPAPLSEADAREMIGEIKGRKILDAVRGMPAVNIDSLIQCLMTVSRIGLEYEEIQAIDINPLVVRGSSAVGVDALVILS